MSQKQTKKYTFKTRYVTFSSSNVHVDLNSFLATKEGQDLVRNAATAPTPTLKKAKKHPKASDEKQGATPGAAAA